MRDCIPADIVEIVLTRKVPESVAAGTHEWDGLSPWAEAPTSIACKLVTPAREPALLAGLEEERSRQHAAIWSETAQQRQEMLLLEVHHRIANSLQIISSILTMKLRTVHSEEARTLLRDMHSRLISVATVQSQLCAPGTGEEIEFRPYLARLCENLVVSMTAEDRAVTLRATTTAGTIKSDKAVSFGLIITELGSGLN